VAERVTASRLVSLVTVLLSYQARLVADVSALVLGHGCRRRTTEAFEEWTSSNPARRRKQGMDSLGLADHSREEQPRFFNRSSTPQQCFGQQAAFEGDPMAVEACSFAGRLELPSDCGRDQANLSSI
jgi:hypothetical protein